MRQVLLSGHRKHIGAMPILALYPKWNLREPKPLDCKSSLHQAANSAMPAAIPGERSAILEQYTQENIAVASIIGSMNPVTRAHI